MMRRKKIIIVLIIIIAASQVIFWGLNFWLNYPAVKKATIGATFSPGQARYLGLDPRKVLIDALDDLGMKNFRLSAYWNVIEPSRGRFDFSELDWQLDEIEQRGGSVILAVGRRLPRWPECHAPKWATALNEATQQTRILAMLNVVISRYKNRGVIRAWQVENEPFLSIFGECPKPDAEFYNKELALVRQLDSRPIVMTESGELSTWFNAATLADEVGVSLYRVVWNKWLGVLRYPLTPAYYRSRAQAIRALGKKIFISELQAEPWDFGQPLPEKPILEQKQLINGRRVAEAIDFGKRAGFDRIYLWGLEWWAYLRERGDTELWETIKEQIKKQ